MPRALIFVCLIVVLFVAAYLLPLAQIFEEVFAWIDQNRAISWLVFIAFYIASTVLLLPGSILTLGAGFLFGLGYGFLITSVASVVGAGCAFLIGRFFARDWVRQKLDAMPKFGLLDRAIGERGLLMVLLTRLSPAFPFNLLNYALGITAVRFPHYILGSWIGMIPGTLLYVYLGSVASELPALLAGDLPESSASGWLLYVGLGATLVLTIIITRVATKALNANLEEVDT